MRSEPILVVMAAGIGSRFGGIKQLASFGAHNECIIDYSLFDAYRAGFRRVIFIVRDDILDDFRRKIGCHVEDKMETRYVLQHLDILPEGCTVPAGRTKPWGTGHAVMCCREYIDAPFAAINGDDFYGRDAFAQTYAFLSQPHAPGEYAMTGFRLENTLSENGSVSRGVCHTSPEGYLESIVENTHIISSCDGPLTTMNGETYRLLPPDTTVSMNLWAFTPDFMDQLWARFPAFYQSAMTANPLKGEYYLPFVVNDTLHDGVSTVRMLHTSSKWYGITYQPDLPAVRDALARLTQEGEYPPALWEK